MHTTCTVYIVQREEFAFSLNWGAFISLQMNACKCKCKCTCQILHNLPQNSSWAAFYPSILYQEPPDLAFCVVFIIAVVVLPR